MMCCCLVIISMANYTTTKLKMAQKRQQPALPIFNRGKRPRLAVVAHPGNRSTDLQQPPAEPWSNAKPTYSWQPSHRTACESNKYHCQAAKQESLHKPASYSSRDNPQQTPSYSHQRPPDHYPAKNYTCLPQEAAIPNYYQQPRYNSTSSNCSQHAPNSSHQPGKHPRTQSCDTQQKTSKAGSYSQTRPAAIGFTLYHKPSHIITSSSTTPTALAVGAAAPGCAAEPVKAKEASCPGPPAVVKKRKPSLRMLTATAQGMKHWAKYKTHTPLLFEIFGQLLRPGEMSQSTGCKLFTIQTSDGPVNCQFWEIDRPLPPLSMGESYRVVGQWDDKTDVVKCFSARAVRVRELENVRQAVEWTDREMRKFVSNLNET